jgi:hypothetical protein
VLLGLTLSGICSLPKIGCQKDSIWDNWSVHENYILFMTFVSREMFVFHATLADPSESSMIILSDCDFCEIHGNNPHHQTSSTFEWYADSNTMLGLNIQLITLITFLNNKTVVQEYIYGVKIPYIQMVRTFHTSMMI